MQQISRWLRRRWPRRPGWTVCTETIYEAVYRGLVLHQSDGVADWSDVPARTGKKSARRLKQSAA